MAQQRPNILFLFPDQHRPDWVGTNSALPLRTPTIDRLTREGVRFDTCYSNSPLCAPARACLASGRGYARCGVPDNGTDYPLDQPTYYQALRDAGYRVAGCGKLDLHKATLDWGLDGSRLLSEWGFTDGIDNEGKLDGSRSFANSGGPKGPYLKALNERGVAERYVQEHADRLKHRDAYTTVVPEDLYCDTWIADNGLRLLSGIPVGQPWHLVVNFTGPHNPMDITPAMRERWQGVQFPGPHANDDPDYSAEDHQRNRQNYAAEIENIDTQMGRLLQAVEARGELENTLVIFASDHGEMLGDHNRWGKSSWRWPSAHVPLVVSGPGVGRGKTTGAMASLFDIGATILDYAGLGPLPEAEARSLRPVLEDMADSHRDVLLSALDSRTESWRLAFDGRYKLVTENGRRSLYDLQSDPWEDRDVSAEQREVADRLEAVLRERGA